MVFKKHGAECKNNYNILPWADPKKVYGHRYIYFGDISGYIRIIYIVVVQLAIGSGRIRAVMLISNPSGAPFQAMAVAVREYCCTVQVGSIGSIAV